MLKALRQSQSLFSRYYLNEEFNDVMFNFELRDDIVIGQPFRYFLVCSLAPFTLRLAHILTRCVLLQCRVAD